MTYRIRNAVRPEHPGLRHRSLATLALMFAIGLGLLPHPADARVALRVSPALLELAGEPGARGETEIGITNEGDEAVAISVSVGPYKGATGEASAVDWFSVEPANFALEPGEERAVTVRLAIPDDLASGGRYAQITVQSGGLSGPDSGASVVGAIGAAMLVVVDGEGALVRSASVTRFAPTLEPDGRIGFATLLANDGNVHLVTSGGVTVMRTDGVPYATAEIPATTAILPGSEEVVATSISLPVDPTETYRADLILDYGGERPATASTEFAPVADLAIETVSACENLDRGPTVTIALANRGDLALRPLTRLTLANANGTVMSEAIVPAAGLVWPDDAVDLVAEIEERLPSGEYEIVVRADLAQPSPDGATAVPPVETIARFQIGGLDGQPIPNCSAG